MTGIRSVGVSRVLQSQVSVLSVLTKYYSDRYQFSCCYQSTTETDVNSVGVTEYYSTAETGP